MPKIRRAALVLTGAAALALIPNGVAFAHVTANAEGAAKGGYASVVFQVPTESPTAGTVKVEITVPTDEPITSARTVPVPGWTAKVTKVALNPPVERDGSTISEAVRTITWTAQPGTRIGPDEFAQFTARLGPLPEKADELVLPAAQTYDDGKVVNWDQPQPAGGDEPEHPAPAIKLAASTGGEHGHGAHSATDPSAAHAGDSTAAAVDNTARWLGGIGLVLGALGLGLGVGAVLRIRRSQG